MMEIIDKLFLELSNVTEAKTHREIELEDVIIRAIRISELWLRSEENSNRSVALGHLYRDFCNIVGHVGE